MTLPGHYDGNLEYLCNELNHDRVYGVISRIEAPKVNTKINATLAILFILFASSGDLITSNLYLLGWNFSGLLFVWKLVELTTYNYFLKYGKK